MLFFLLPLSALLLTLFTSISSLLRLSCAGFPRLSPLFSLTLISFYHQCSSPYYCYYYHLTMQNFLHIRFNLITIVLCLLSPSYFCFLPFSCPLLPVLFVISFFHFSFLPLPQLVSSHCPPSLFRFLISLLPHPLFSPILLSAHSCFLLLTQSTSSSLTFSTAAHPVFLPLLLPTIVLLLYTSSVSCLLPPPFSSLICFSTPPHSLFCFYF